MTAGDNYHYQNCNTYATCVGTYYGSYVTAQTFMPTMGNHDYDNPPVGLTAYNNYFTWLPTSPDSQRRWYDFVVGDVHFFMLDGNGNQSTQSTWLATAVPAVDLGVEHRGHSPGALFDRLLRRHRPLPSCPTATYGIDFVISGHNHHYERLVKADGGNIVRYFIDGYGGTDAANHSECGTNQCGRERSLPGRCSRRHEDHRIGHVDHVRVLFQHGRLAGHVHAGRRRH